MAELGLDQIERILWCTKMDVAAEHWHLESRALPALRELGSERRDPWIGQLAEFTTEAIERLEVARKVVGKAATLAAECVRELSE